MIYYLNQNKKSQAEKRINKNGQINNEKVRFEAELNQ